MREAMPENHRIRLHRAISWYRCAEGYSEADDDISFIALWIALNSCYAINGDGEQHEERTEFGIFAETLVAVDTENRIHGCLWQNYSNFVRTLIDNHYLYPPFWKSQMAGDDDWKPRFAASRRFANTALAKSDTPKLLSIVFDRLYVLRNQLLHGGATHLSSINRSQVTDGKRMLMELLPIIIRLMFDDTQDWGRIHFPVVNGEN